MGPEAVDVDSAFACFVEAVVCEVGARKNRRDGGTSAAGWGDDVKRGDHSDSDSFDVLADSPVLRVDLAEGWEPQIVHVDGALRRC